MPPLPRTRTAALILALAVTGCAISGETPGETPSVTAVSVAPHITLSAPPTLSAKSPTAVAIDSSGHNGKQVKLYPFQVPFDTPADCTSTVVSPVTVTLIGGPQAVNLNPFQTGGDVYWVLSGTGFNSDCGASRTRILPVPYIYFQDFTSSVTHLGPSGYETPVIIQLETIDQYSVGARVTNAFTGQAPALVTWVGPFKTAAEAQASPCPTAPVATTNTFRFNMAEARIWDGDIMRVWAVSPISIKQPGVYRLLVSMEATDYSAAVIPVCEASLLVTAQ